MVRPNKYKKITRQNIRAVYHSITSCIYNIKQQGGTSEYQTGTEFFKGWKLTQQSLFKKTKQIQ
jgi:hypothetical protein